MELYHHPFLIRNIWVRICSSIYDYVLYILYSHLIFLHVYLESFHVSDNLLLGVIPEDLLKCDKLHTIDMSGNNFEGTIPVLMGQLSNLTHLYLHANKIKGTIPPEVFNLDQIEVIMLQSNKLTGTIPSLVGGLNDLKILTMNHNSLVGTIPPSLQNLAEIKYLHLHRNQLTGTAPDLDHMKRNGTTNISYITDCGFPDYSLPKPLECKSCTMCCNSDEICNKMDEKLSIPMWSIALCLSLLIPMVASLLFYTERKLGYESSHELPSVYVGESTNSFILSEKIFAKTMFFFTMTSQVLLFTLYLEATVPNPEKAGVEIPYRCTENERECINLNVVDTYSWVLFTFVMLCFVGADFAMSINQLREGILLKDFYLLANGFLLLAITTLALTTSIFYCLQVVSNDIDLILNAVVLLFIIDLDERIFLICTKLLPEWTKEISEEVEKKYSSRFRRQLRSQQASRSL